MKIEQIISICVVFAFKTFNVFFFEVIKSLRKLLVILKFSKLLRRVLKAEIY